MPTPVFPTCYEVAVKGQLFGQECDNIWHVEGPDPFDATVAGTVAGIFQTGYSDIQAVLSADYSINEVHVQNFAGLATGEFTLAITPPQPGGVGLSSSPGSVCLCVSLRTAVAGRSTRGRKYISGLAEQDVGNNALDPDTAAAIRVAIANMVDTLAANGTPLVVFSKTNNVITPVTAVTLVDLFVDSQRRRLTGRGR